MHVPPKPSPEDRDRQGAPTGEGQSLRILICDDEPLALDRLSDLVESCEQVELTGAYSDPIEALEVICEARPDLVLMDVEMPRMDGFDLVELMSRRLSGISQNVPMVCFVTAHPHSAPEAFESGALDFLCKPVRLHRLRKCLDRARTALTERESASKLRALLAQLEELKNSGLAEEKSLWAYRGVDRVRLPVRSLDWLQAEREHVHLHSAGRSYLVRAPLGRLAEELAPYGFMRVHRSAVIHTARVGAIERSGNRLTIVLTCGARIPVGRRFRRQARKLPTASA